MATIAQTKTYRKIKRQIEAWVNLKSPDGINFKRWYCGITKNPKVRKGQHSAKYDVYFFKSWYAYSKDIASALETHFHNVKGMKDKDMKGGAKDDTWYIYVFKNDPTIIDLLFREP